MTGTQTTYQLPTNPDEYRVYKARVDAAAGTDIEMLEDAWMAACNEYDWTEADRLADLVTSARAAAGYEEA